jgi:hypothetical protein
MGTDQKWIVAIVAGVLALCLCVGVACVAFGGLALVTTRSVVSEFTPEVVLTRIATLEVLPGGSEPQPEAEATPVPMQENPEPASGGALETLNTLENAEVPINDPRELAERLGGKKNIPETVPAPPLELGMEKAFWVTNIDTNDNAQVTATLHYMTPHLAFWVQNGVSFNEADLRRLSDTFENKIYPTNREFFGSEWSPGIDEDVRLYVLFARGLGTSIAGYFSAADSLPPEAHPYSNAHEMFLMNADTLDLGEPYIYSTMTHEFQHMIHWYRDRNEESWMNEGFSVLSELLNGYDSGGFEYSYVADPDLQLTYWPSSSESVPHYGASFLFVAYFLDRFGEEATKAVVAHPDNGMDSIDSVLASLGAVDPQTGQPITADDVFADWVVTTFLNDADVEDGRYAYRLYADAPRARPTEEIGVCEDTWEDRTVRQYGVDYIQLNCLGSYTLNFQGATEVGVLPVDPNSGDYAFWSNKGDESNMTLTRTFDFTGVSGPLSLEYATWYDLEEDYDYLYLVASEDGQNWQTLNTPSGRDRSEDPSGNAYGWGYNGASGEWIDESVDLSQFAGKQVQIRFEYVTDAAVNGEGLLLDDVRVPEIDYSADFETDEGGWEAAGFVRIQNRLPQTFRISLIQDGQEVTVDTITLQEGQSVEIPLELTDSQRGAVLVVSGITRFTTQEASYRFRFIE